MTRDDVITLGRKAAAICPAQKFNAETPDAWEALLGHLNFDDAVAALYELGQTQRFIAPADIIATVRRQRAERLKGVIVPAPSPEDAEVPARYRARLRAHVHQAAAPRPDRPALPSGDRGEQFRRHGQHYVDPTHKPDQDRRPASVRDALAAARRECREVSPTRAPVAPGPHEAVQQRVAAESGEPLRTAGAGLRAIVREETGR